MFARLMPMWKCQVRLWARQVAMSNCRETVLSCQFELWFGEESLRARPIPLSNKVKTFRSRETRMSKRQVTMSKNRSRV